MTESGEEIRIILRDLLDEQRKTNQLLLLLIQALAEDGEDPDAMPTSYLDGTPIQGHQPVRSNSLWQHRRGAMMSTFIGSARETQIAAVRVRRGWFGKLVVQVRYKIERPKAPPWPGVDLPRMRALPLARCQRK